MGDISHAMFIIGRTAMPVLGGYLDMASAETFESLPIASNDVDHQSEDLDPKTPFHGFDAEFECEVSLSPQFRDADKKGEITEEEVNEVLEVIAATGKFWHDWDTLKSLLSFRLKQVLAEYPEAQMSIDEQNSLRGETYMELVTRLDEALLCFIEGPPFTLQRLCEILLDARSIYPNLSKLALALEKNLLVTSTLRMSTDPYPSALASKLDDHDKEPGGPVAQSSPMQNGVDSAVCDEDIEMTDAEDAREEMTDAEDTREDVKKSDTETAEGITNDEASDTGCEQSTSKDPPVESSPSNEPQNLTS
ncbi:hypothetical protein Sjap_007583 [Stephania japonica]|uniref:Serine/threonine-protein phosphatase 4 regulatory subunit 2 n=1 Tax=Stephania japonica TaxID=461633 RepID=A0AAP0PBG5_9MAGN